jgi:hydrogenase/urease accessory protein HupE
MFQRLQTVWLFLASIALTGLFFQPVFTNGDNSHLWTIYTTGFYVSKHGVTQQLYQFTWPIVANVAAIIICCFNILLFKNRTIQLQLSIVAICVIAILIFLTYLFGKEIPYGITGAHFGLGTYLPFFAILFLVLTIFGINKDERLIRSAERLR